MKKGGDGDWLGCSSTYTSKVCVGEGFSFQSQNNKVNKGKKSRAVFFNNT